MTLPARDDMLLRSLDEHHRVEIRAVRAAIPLGRLRHDALEGFAPVFLDAQGHGEGQKLFEHLRRFDGAIEAVGFDVIQEIFKAENAFHGARALLGVRGHKPAESTDHQARQNSRNDERKRRHAHGRGDAVASPGEKQADNDANAQIRSAHAVRAAAIVAVSDQRFEDAALDVRQIFVESGFPGWTSRRFHPLCRP